MSGEASGPPAWRHALAILMPGAIAIGVPALILSGDFALGETPLVVLGALVITAGFGLWAWTVRLLATVGRGTLAPWDPTSNVVAVGPYRHMRNPMITGVLAVLLGEASLFESLPLLVWAAAFFALNHVFFIAVEEPGLECRFGDVYREYKRTVPRWIPRRRVA